MNPETVIRNKLRSFLQARGWHVEIFTCNAYQKGIPDLGIWHRKHGFRWIDVKCPDRNSLTVEQQAKWPKWEDTQIPGLQVWILTAATEAEYNKLFQKPNWRMFWKPSYGRKQRELIESWKGLSGECRGRISSTIRTSTTRK